VGNCRLFSSLFLCWRCCRGAGPPPFFPTPAPLPCLLFTALLLGFFFFPPPSGADATSRSFFPTAASPFLFPLLVWLHDKLLFFPLHRDERVPNGHSFFFFPTTKPAPSPPFPPSGPEFCRCPPPSLFLCVKYDTGVHLDPVFFPSTARRRSPDSISSLLFSRYREGKH